MRCPLVLRAVLKTLVLVTLAPQLYAQTPRPENLPPTPNGVTLVENLKYREGHNRWVLNVIHESSVPDKLRPAILLVHGGGWSMGDQYRFTKLGYHLAAEGYVVVLPTYRLLQDAPFPAHLQDIKCAIRWTRANAETYHIDVRRIGTYGNSAGGTIALTAALTNGNPDFESEGPFQHHSSHLQAVVCSGAVGNMQHPSHSKRATWVYRKLAGAQRGSTNEEQIARTLQRASPASYVSGKAPPILLIHGAKDEIVVIVSTDEFYTAMQSQGANITYLRFEDAGHAVMGQKSRETTPALLKFFRTQLRGRDKPTNPLN